MLFAQSFEAFSEYALSISTFEKWFGDFDTKGKKFEEDIL